MQGTEKKEWEKRSCNGVVGGGTKHLCPGSKKQTDNDWCCSIVKKYPDMIPHRKWGAGMQGTEKKEWEKRSCNGVVGGSTKHLCPGSKKQTDNDWCCSIVKKYPDMIPHSKWGAGMQGKEKREWGKRSCDGVVGGSTKHLCPGSEKQTDNDWCCSIVKKYPDMIPHSKWGTGMQGTEKREWGKRS